GGARTCMTRQTSPAKTGPRDVRGCVPSGAPRVIRTPTTVGLNDVSLPIGLPERCSLVVSIHLPPSYQDGTLPNELSEQNGAPCMESNLRPAAYKAAAHPTELTEHGAGSVNR